MRWVCIVTIGLLCVATQSCGSSRPQSAATPTGDVVIATARQIIDRSADYEGRQVSLTGEIVLECVQGCWIFLDDGTARIYVDFKPADISIPQMIGSRITVIGHIEGSGGNVKILGDWVGFQ